MFPSIIAKEKKKRKQTSVYCSLYIQTIPRLPRQNILGTHLIFQRMMILLFVHLNLVFATGELTFHITPNFVLLIGRIHFPPKANLLSEKSVFKASTYFVKSIILLVSSNCYLFFACVYYWSSHSLENFAGTGISLQSLVENDTPFHLVLLVTIVSLLCLSKIIKTLYPILVKNYMYYMSF